MSSLHEYDTAFVGEQPFAADDWLDCTDRMLEATLSPQEHSVVSRLHGLGLFSDPETAPEVAFSMFKQPSDVEAIHNTALSKIKRRVGEDIADLLANTYLYQDPTE